MWHLGFLFGFLVYREEHAFITLSRDSLLIVLSLDFAVLPLDTQSPVLGGHAAQLESRGLSGLKWGHTHEQNPPDSSESQLTSSLGSLDNLRFFSWDLNSQSRHSFFLFQCRKMGHCASKCSKTELVRVIETSAQVCLGTGGHASVGFSVPSIP